VDENLHWEWQQRTPDERRRQSWKVRDERMKQIEIGELNL